MGPSSEMGIVNLFNGSALLDKMATMPIYDKKNKNS